MKQLIALFIFLFCCLCGNTTQAGSLRTQISQIQQEIQQLDADILDSIELADALYSITHPKYTTVRAANTNILLLMVSNSRQEAGNTGVGQPAAGKQCFGLPRVFYLPTIAIPGARYVTLTDIQTVCPIARLLIFPEHIFW